MEILHRRTPDYGLFAVVVALVAIGVVMIYSASSIVAQEQLRDSAFFLKRQLTWAALGIVAMAVAMRVHYQKLRRYTFVFLLMAVVFMIMVLVPPFGRMAGGARRWLTLG
ncbi:MAG: FtsW/RodA/SpoVE family cell cycle protein, partial [Armatimonadetes bacterium]|nr:FtsW/RodA/SpoVE family cell cycle protein [Armatimonadota bacterium]